MSTANTLLDLALSFLKIGLLAFGGGNSMLKMVEYEVVTNRAWLTADQFSEFTGTTFLFPGLTALKLCAMIGFKVGGLLGSFIAVISMNLPALAITLVGFYLLRSYAESPQVKKLTLLLQYSALSVLFAGAYAVAVPILKDKFSLLYTFGALVFLMLLIFFDLSPFIWMLVFIGVFFFL